MPVNRDGEVAEHRRIEPGALLAIMADRAMTVDATLVTLDTLIRRGWTPSAPRSLTRASFAAHHGAGLPH